MGGFTAYSSDASHWVSGSRGVYPRRLCEMRGLRLSALVFLAALVLALAVAPLSFAQQSSVGTYGGEGGEAQEVVVQGEAPGKQAEEAGALPFTGLDLGLVLGGGLLLVGVGAAMARLVPKGDS
jgi:hypothetical protein